MTIQVDYDEEDFNPYMMPARLGIRKRAIKKDPTKVSGSATEVVKEQKRIDAIESESAKQLEVYKKTYEKQAVYLKEMISEIASLHYLIKDSATKMNQDCVDDVYSISHIQLAIAKIEKKLSGYTKIPVETHF